MANEELRIITQEERTSMDPDGMERVSRSDGGSGAILLGRVAFFGEYPTVATVVDESKTEVA